VNGTRRPSYVRRHAAVQRAERATERLNRFLDFRVHREMRAYADEAAEREEARR
jgi:hypothetical protein